jgi:adenylate kinase
LISEHVSIEALLSAESQRQTPLGASLRRAIKQRCAPADETVLAVLRRWFFARRADSGFRLLGFPATALQALVFDEWLEARSETLDVCVAFESTAPERNPVHDFYRDRGLLCVVGRTDAAILSQS